jgi:CheY-like chemotaxis protein
MKKVIIVDDDTDILEAVSILLRDEDYVVVGVSDEDEAQAIEQLVKKEKPDVVLLDIFMGNVDGRELCKMIKSNADFKNIPVILMSAHTKTEDSAVKSKADAYISKPFEITQLIEIVDKFVNKKPVSLSA